MQSLQAGAKELSPVAINSKGTVLSKQELQELHQSHPLHVRHWADGTAQ
jgi:hypothetical protein